MSLGHFPDITTQTTTLQRTLTPTSPQSPLSLGQSPKPKSTGPTQTLDSPAVTYKSHGLKMGETAKGRMDKLIDNRKIAKDKAKEKSLEPTSFKAKAGKLFDRFKNFVTNKEVKSAQKNVGKLAKSVGDAASKTLATSSSVAKEAGKVTTGIGAGAQIIETGVDLYLAKQKIDKAKVDLETVNKGHQQKRDEQSLGVKIGKKGQEVLDKTDSLNFWKGRSTNCKKDLVAAQKNLAQAKTDIAEAEKKMSALRDNLSFARHIDIGNDVLLGEHSRLQKKLFDLKQQLPGLEGSVKTLEKRDQMLDRVVGRREKSVKGATEELTQLKKDLNKLETTDKLKFRMAEKDLNSFNDSVPLERAKLIKSLYDGLKAATDLAQLGVVSGSVAQEALKLTGGMIGVVVGPITAGVGIKDMVVDITANREALKIKSQATKTLASKEGIKQDDAELLSIAERIRLKQKKQSVDKGLSATKNAFGALGGLGTAASGAAAIAAVVGGTAAAAATAAAILTPIGWGLAGAAALAAIGYGVYKLARHLHSKAIKGALQDSLQNMRNKPDGDKISDLNLSPKDAKKMDKVTAKYIKSLASQGITKTTADLTVGEVREYASKKLLARDTGVATQTLYARFKDEMTAKFGTETPTPKEMGEYLDAEKNKKPADSAVGLMGKLGLALKPDEAIDLMRDGKASDGIKFLSKKLKLR